MYKLFAYDWSRTLLVESWNILVFMTREIGSNGFLRGFVHQQFVQQQQRPKQERGEWQDTAWMHKEKKGIISHDCHAMRFIRFPDPDGAPSILFLKTNTRWTQSDPWFSNSDGSNNDALLKKHPCSHKHLIKRLDNLYGTNPIMVESQWKECVIWLVT